MNAPKFWMVIPALLVAGAVSVVNAKLPAAPPMDDAAKAKVAEAKAKAAEAAKKDRADEEKAMDRAVERYKKEKGIKTVAAPAKKK
jgi:predicted 2-oxoglutarate/Fe(II)-dependent dioxygenase YbiX